MTIGEPVEPVRVRPVNVFGPDRTRRWWRHTVEIRDSGIVVDTADGPMRVDGPVLFDGFGLWQLTDDRGDVWRVEGSGLPGNSEPLE